MMNVNEMVREVALRSWRKEAVDSDTPPHVALVYHAVIFYSIFSFLLVYLLLFPLRKLFAKAPTRNIAALRATHSHGLTQAEIVTLHALGGR